MATVTASLAPPNRLDTAWGVLVFRQRKLHGVVPLGARALRVGRGMDCDIVIDESSVSRAHCSLTRVDGCVVATDLDSTNGTWRFGERIRRVPLRRGDELSVGTALLKLVALGRGDPALHEDLYSELYLDGATGWHNRRGLRVCLDAALGVLPAGTELGVVLLSIDDIATLGLRHGVAAQRSAAAHIAHAVAPQLPPGTIAARTDVGEFTLVIAGLAQARLDVLAESLRVSASQAPLMLGAQATTLALAVGTASHALPAARLSALLCGAEDALLRDRLRLG